MFQNSFQNGMYFDIFDPKIPYEKVKNLYKVAPMQNNQINNKIFDKQLKTFIFQFNSQFAKIIFPREDKKDLGLIQQYLILQVNLIQSKSWHIELTISDINKTKKRVILSNAIMKIQKKPFFIKYPYGKIHQNIWTTVVIDLYSFINAFKDQTYRSLDSIQIIGHFKLRKIFTTQFIIDKNCHQQGQQKSQIDLLPKNFHLNENIESQYHLIEYEDQKNFEDIFQQNIHRTPSKGSKREIFTPRTQKIYNSKNKDQPSKKQRRFASNSNGPAQLKKQSDTQSFENSQFRLSKHSTQTNKNSLKFPKINTKSEAVKKQRKSINSKNKKIQQRNISQHKNKINPWKSAKKPNQVQTDNDSQFSRNQIENQREIRSAKTTMFKTKNTLAQKFNESKNNKGFQVKSDYSDSDYAELSQKFSTLSDGKFFKNTFNSQNLVQKTDQPHQQHDQIEQNIEMEANSMHESIKDNQINIIQEKNQNKIEALQNVDSLQFFERENQNLSTVNKSIMGTSLYGFGQKALKKIMTDVERPYSPPLGQREITEQASQKNEEAQNKEVELMYDPVLNCYYDHKTHTYYELKN